jgi:hypothetical protein
MTSNEKYLPDENDHSPVDNYVDQLLQMKLDAAVYKVVHGKDALDIDINSKEFMDECFREAPYCDAILEYFEKANDEMNNSIESQPYYKMLKDQNDGFLDSLLED